jgi:hypothetical protein
MGTIARITKGRRRMSRAALRDVSELREWHKQEWRKYAGRLEHKPGTGVVRKRYALLADFHLWAVRVLDLVKYPDHQGEAPDV